MQHIREDQIWWTFARWWHFSTCWFQMFHIISSLYNIFHFTIQAVFSLVMVNLISLPSLYSSDLTCAVSHGCWLWQMTDDAKEEGWGWPRHLPWPALLHHGGCQPHMDPVRKSWNQHMTSFIIFALGIVQVNYHRPDSRWRRLHYGRWTSPDPASPPPPNHRNTWQSEKGVRNFQVLVLGSVFQFSCTACSLLTIWEKILKLSKMFQLDHSIQKIKCHHNLKFPVTREVFIRIF